MMRIASPWWLGLIAVAIVLIVLWLLRRRWQRFPFPDVATALGRAGRIPERTVMAGALAALALAPLAVALARPQEVLSRRLERAEGVDLVVALDVSGSMSALDF